MAPKSVTAPKSATALMPQRWLKRWASFGCHGAGWSSPAVLVGWSSVVAPLGDGCWREIARQFQQMVSPDWAIRINPDGITINPPEFQQPCWNRALLFVSRFLPTSDLGCLIVFGAATILPTIREVLGVVRSALPSRQGIWCWNALGTAMRREWKLLTSAVASYALNGTTRYKNRQVCMYVYIYRLIVHGIN